MRINCIFYLALFLFLITTTCTLSQNRKFGFGVLVGEPTGISLKYWITSLSAIDAGMAWSFVKETSLHIHADYLLHSYNIFQADGKVPLYYGVGGRIKTGRYEDARIGFRMVLGIEYIFNRLPFDIFLEVAPILDLAPATVIRGNIGFGARYFIE